MTRARKIELYEGLIKEWKSELESYKAEGCETYAEFKNLVYETGAIQFEGFELTDEEKWDLDPRYPTVHGVLQEILEVAVATMSIYW